MTILRFWPWTIWLPVVLVLLGVITFGYLVNGEEICAWIRMKPGSPALDAAAVRKFAEDKLAHYKIPRYVLLVEEFPMTVTGKIRKVQMREETTEKLGLDPKGQQ